MNPPTGEPRRASAALVLGVLSGALAALTVLPTIVPMTYRVVGSAEASEFQRVRLCRCRVGLLGRGRCAASRGAARPTGHRWRADS